jgi:hypothetical protein
MPQRHVLSTLLAALISIAPHSVQAQGFKLQGDDWRTLQTDPKPDAKISFVMVNIGAGLVRIEGDRRLAAVAVASASDVRSHSQGVLYEGRIVHPVVVRNYYVVDCRKNTSRIAKRFVHDFDGTIIYDVDVEEPMKLPKQGTIGEQIVDTICGREQGVTGATPWDYLRDLQATSP